jgi:hypothetical protein
VYALQSINMCDVHATLSRSINPVSFYVETNTTVKRRTLAGFEYLIVRMIYQPHETGVYCGRLVIQNKADDANNHAVDVTIIVLSPSETIPVTFTCGNSLYFGDCYSVSKKKREFRISNDRKEPVEVTFPSHEEKPVYIHIIHF